MNLQEALAVYLYLKDQYQPTEEQRLARAAAWEIICRNAQNVINYDRWVKGRSPSTLPPSERETT